MSFSIKDITEGQTGVNYNPSGSKYSRYGARSGFGSLLDGNIIKQKQEQEKSNFGSGRVKFKALDDNGQAVAGATINIGGRVHRADDDGNFTVVDGDFLDEQYKKFEERENYIDAMLKKIMVSNEMAQFVLGKTIYDNLEKGKQPTKAPMSEDLVKANANPEFLNSIDPSSVVYALGITKLRLALRENLPVIQHQTPDSVQDHNV